MLRKSICNRGQIKSIIFYSTAGTPKPKKTSLLQMLSSEFEDISVIKKALQNVEIQNIGFNEWKIKIDVLKKYHFQDKDCLKMIKRYPYILKIPQDDFEATALQWFYSDLGYKNFQWILLSQPQLLEVDTLVIRERLPELRSLFQSSNSLSKLLINCPNVMSDDWNKVKKKITYLVEENRFSIKDVVSACALTKSLEFIKFRLDLLEKCGVYKLDRTPYHKINYRDKSRHINPSLKDILLTNTSNFVKIAHISAEEYVICHDLFNLEEDYNSDDDDDDDDMGNSYNKFN